MIDDLPISELMQRRLARMVLAGWRFYPRATSMGGWRCDIPPAVTANRTWGRVSDWTLGGLVQKQWRVYQRWMHMIQ